jgi:hypothetical protein
MPLPISMPNQIRNRKQTSQRKKIQKKNQIFMLEVVHAWIREIHFRKILGPKLFNPLVSAAPSGLRAQQNDLVEIIFLPGWKMLCMQI